MYPLLCACAALHVHIVLLPSQHHHNKISDILSYTIVLILNLLLLLFVFQSRQTRVKSRSRPIDVNKKLPIIPTPDMTLEEIQIMEHYAHFPQDVGEQGNHGITMNANTHTQRNTI